MLLKYYNSMNISDIYIYKHISESTNSLMTHFLRFPLRDVKDIKLNTDGDTFKKQNKKT